MAWTVSLHDDFLEEFKRLPEAVQNTLLAYVELLKARGPHLKRPHADTLNGSKHANMKELRFKKEGGIWRIAYALDPERTAILLIAGNKSGKNERQFYKKLIATADARFNEHIEALEKEKNNGHTR